MSNGSDNLKNGWRTALEDVVKESLGEQPAETAGAADPGVSDAPYVKSIPELMLAMQQVFHEQTAWARSYQFPLVPQVLEIKGPDGPVEVPPTSSKAPEGMTEEELEELFGELSELYRGVMEIQWSKGTGGHTVSMRRSDGGHLKREGQPSGDTAMMGVAKEFRETIGRPMARWLVEESTWEFIQQFCGEYVQRACTREEFVESANRQFHYYFGGADDGFHVTPEGIRFRIGGVEIYEPLPDIRLTTGVGRHLGSSMAAHIYRLVWLGDENKKKM